MNTHIIGWKFFGNLMDAGRFQFVVKKVLVPERIVSERRMAFGLCSVGDSKNHSLWCEIL